MAFLQQFLASMNPQVVREVGKDPVKKSQIGSDMWSTCTPTHLCSKDMPESLSQRMLASEAEDRTFILC